MTPNAVTRENNISATQVATIESDPAPRQNSFDSRDATRRDVALAAVAILVAPIAWVLAGGTSMLQAGVIDANVYTGYVNNYGVLLERYGLTYYSTRIATIFPERLLGDVIGRLPGYLAWHYLLAVASLGAIYGIARRFYGPPTAAVVTAMLATIPYGFPER